MDELRVAYRMKKRGYEYVIIHPQDEWEPLYAKTFRDAIDMARTMEPNHVLLIGAFMDRIIKKAAGLSYNKFRKG